MLLDRFLLAESPKEFCSGSPRDTTIRLAVPLIEIQPFNDHNDLAELMVATSTSDCPLCEVRRLSRQDKPLYCE